MDGFTSSLVRAERQSQTDLEIVIGISEAQWTAVLVSLCDRPHRDDGGDCQIMVSDAAGARSRRRVRVEPF
jgi:hypothetical protein